MKILIAAPYAPSKEDTLNEWMEYINSIQSEHDLSVMIVLNNCDVPNFYAKELKLKVGLQDKYPLIIKRMIETEDMGVLQRIAYAREQIRLYAIEFKFDAIFWLDTDTIPHDPKTIDILEQCGAQYISGVYFFKNSGSPVIVDYDTGSYMTQEKLIRLFEKQELGKAAITGLGCVLQLRDNFVKFTFRYEDFGTEVGEDYGLCYQLHNAEIPRYVHPVMLCKHIGLADVKEKLEKEKQ